MLIGLLFAVGICVPPIRRAILRSAGIALVVNEHVDSVESIVVSGEAHEAGVLEAADLVNSGVAAQIAIFTFSFNPQATLTVS